MSLDFGAGITGGLPGAPGGVMSEFEREQAARAKRLRECYATVFRGAEGREVLGDLLRCYGFDVETGIEKPVFRAGDDALNASRIDGQKEVVRRVLHMAGFRMDFSSQYHHEKKDTQTAE
jgi:hypothetical protein